ncbi:XRE family transcriptional regulator [Corynebacterium sp. MSK158]|nr:XRE family transcriptional regulator [Corynebacterium sp. MSK158]MDK8693618.1 XRE family transcriptional regulator [Corynebacterium sp. MSK158]
MFLLSLDEIDRVKRLHHITSTTGLAEKTDLNRKTWTTALNTRRPTVSVLEALAALGANPSKVLVAEELAA